MNFAKQAYAAGRKLEAEGNYAQAADKYKEATRAIVSAGPANYATGSTINPNARPIYDYSSVEVGGEHPAQIGRRAINCYLKFVQSSGHSAQNSTPVTRTDSPGAVESAGSMIGRTIYLGLLYDNMINFEPHNPAWYYMSGLAHMAMKNEFLNNYTAALLRFQQCKREIAASHRESELGPKCDALIAQVRPIQERQNRESMQHFAQGLGQASHDARAVGDRMLINEHATNGSRRTQAKNQAAAGNYSGASTINSQVDASERLYQQRFGK